ncbi:MAG: cupin domain-containing protein [Alphaproteobacteria bacterium]|nr:cupin domain-containing protein [Alphaproteobacteria bacterium]MBU0794462.1 cupin domain-containing protein [Alphaproteobacteria bacterium]MBU0875059.1 cupin domain-containing protein [Alphaproteobacteria bacterium]MBU1768808.1 cupin domain-containing protein [Alphaproteobacteria bacterium]
MRLADFDIALFLRDYWQRKPLLIRNPWDQWVNPLEPDDLAGLACEEEVESRLITQAGTDWAVEHGPLDEARFGELGDAPWTLLVQAVDHYVEEVAALMGPFRFIPNWRMDDVMVSYATDGGGVGPHFDQYDVFLIQGAGKRRWQIGGLCDEATPLRPHDDLRLLADFVPTQEWVLEPGDILYLPPGIAHDGVAVGPDCMTYSIGFRAPSQRDLIEDWSAHVAEGLREDDRYADPGLPSQTNPGEITPEALARLHDLATQALADRASFARWFGQASSTPKYPQADWRPEAPVSVEEVQDALNAGLPVRRNPASRFVFVREGEEALSLFVDGEAFACTGEAAGFAERLCAADDVPIETVDAAVLALIAALASQGSVTLGAED